MRNPSRVHDSGGIALGDPQHRGKASQRAIALVIDRLATSAAAQQVLSHLRLDA
jgi:hypothetical protein